MRRGHMATGCFAAYVPQGPRSAAGDEAAFARACAMLDAINRMGSGPDSRVVVSADDVSGRGGMG